MQHIGQMERLRIEFQLERSDLRKKQREVRASVSLVPSSSNLLYSLSST